MAGRAMDLAVIFNLAAFALTFSLAAFVRSRWPGLIWLTFVVGVVNTLPLWLIDSGDPRLDTLFPNSVMHLGLYAIVRLIRWQVVRASGSGRNTREP